MINTFKYIACCLVGVLALLPLQAQNIIRPKIAGPGNLWVNSYNGVLFFGQTDFETQNSAMPMQLRFYYNSSASSVDYGYGLGFSMGYEMRYHEDAIGGVDIETGDGRTDHFTKYGDEYKAPAGVFSTLVRPTFDTYLLTTTDGTRYYFDSAYHRKVTAIEDRNGNKTTFKYQDTLLVEVKDAAGHTITLSYTDGLMTQASATFSPGKYKYEYDGLRRLRKRIDPMGNATIYDYSRQNKLDEITDANGNKTLIAYNDAGMVSRLKTDESDKSIRYDGDKTVFIDYTEPNNVYSFYRWDDKGRAIEKVGLCCGIQSILKYDDNDNVAQRIDANGNTTNFTYDERGNMLTLRDPLGYIEQYTYEPNFNQVTSFCDKNGNNYMFSYDTKGNLTALDGPLEFNNHYSYDEHGWQTMATDANGNVTLTAYNTDGTKSSVTNPNGGVIKYEYDTYGRMKSQTDPMGNTTSYIYDNLGRVINETNALGYTTAISYDKIGNTVRIQDAAGNITAYTYDGLSRLTSMTDAMGGVYSYKYDGQGNVISVIDPIGIEERYTYNDRNKVESFTNGEGERTNYDYDNNGNLIAEMRPNGNVISYEYDELDRLIEISDNIGLIAIYTYDGNGNQLSVTDGVDRTITCAYDALNRRITETLPSGSKSKYDYDKNCNLISITDAMGSVTRYSYNSLNQLLCQTDALGAKTQFDYDNNGNITRVIDANGNITSYMYDAQNNNTSITFANGRSLQFTYDELSRIIISKDRGGREFKYSYNAVGDLLTKTYPNGEKDKYTYDGISRMVSAVNKNADISFLYDRTGRLLSEIVNGRETRYSYNVLSGERALVYPSGFKVIEQLNARNLLTSIRQNGDEIVTMNYNASGQKTSQCYANGITTNFEYNVNSWLKTIAADHETLSLEMDYDAIGNITNRRDMLDANRSESYDYDRNSQIISFKRGTSVEKSYMFDPLGNRIKVLDNGVTTCYKSNNINAYVSITGGLSINPQYDENGNLLSDGKHSYNYDFNNKLISIDNGECTFKYDALGRRIAKNNTLYYYVGDQMVEEVTDNVTTSYLYGNNLDEALLMKRGDDMYYYHTNILGSVMVITNGRGEKEEVIEYDVFGQPTFINNSGVILSNSSINNNILFTGREYDYYSSIYYFRNRFQHPNIGSFMQKDPLVFYDFMNDYSYVGNKTTLYSDPYGLSKNAMNSWIAKIDQNAINSFNQSQGNGLGSKLGNWLNDAKNWFNQGGQNSSNPFNGGSDKLRIPINGNYFKDYLNPTKLGKLGWLGLLLNAGIAGYKGYNEKRCTDFWDGLGSEILRGASQGMVAGATIGAVTGAIAGGSGGVVLGAGIGSVPAGATGALVGGVLGGYAGAVSGAAWGAITSAVGYTVGYWTNPNHY